MGSSSKRLILFAPGRSRAGATSPASGRTSCTTRRRPAAGCPRSTTGRSSTRSATRCERSRGRLGASGPSLTSGPTISFAFNLGKIPDQGEDSDPICPRRARPGPGRGVRRDGRGRRHRLRDPGRAAYRRLHRVPDRPGRGRTTDARPARAGLEPQRQGRGARTSSGRSRQALEERLAELKAPPSGCVPGCCGRCRRPWPWSRCSGPSRAGRTGPAHVFWAGDSRAYVLEPAGVRQLSTDDLRDPGDAMANLRRDSVVSNAMSADTDFHVNYRRVELQAPFLLVRCHRRLLRLRAHADALRAPGAAPPGGRAHRRRLVRRRCRRRSPRSPATTPPWRCSGSAPTSQSSRRCSPHGSPSSRRTSSPRSTSCAPYHASRAGTRGRSGQRQVTRWRALWARYQDGYERYLHPGAGARRGGSSRRGSRLRTPRPSVDGRRSRRAGR